MGIRHAAFILSLVSGCATMSEELRVSRVRNRAAFDLSCAAASVSVGKIDDKTYGAVGCDKKASYVLLTCADQYFVEACSVHLDAVQVGGVPSKPAER
jgi:hypothetical protein